MGQNLGTKLRVLIDKGTHRVIAHWCPGCNELHQITVGTPVPNVARWGFNGDAVKPTFNPSVHIRTGHHVPNHDPDGCWCSYNKEHPEEVDPVFTCKVCHYFITDGMIAFCTDSTHSLSGKTVELPDLPVFNHET